MTVDEYIYLLDGEQKAIVSNLRKLILAANSDVQEQIKWNVPTYSINKGMFAIMAHKTHVNLQIFNGAKLSMSAVFSGTGKNMRHIKFFTLVDLDRLKLKEILYEAIEFDRS